MASHEIITRGKSAKLALKTRGAVKAAGNPVRVPAGATPPTKTPVKAAGKTPVKAAGKPARAPKAAVAAPALATEAAAPRKSHKKKLVAASPVHSRLYDKALAASTRALMSKLSTKVVAKVRTVVLNEGGKVPPMGSGEDEAELEQLELDAGDEGGAHEGERAVEDEMADGLDEEAGVATADAR